MRLGLQVGGWGEWLLVVRSSDHHGCLAPLLASSPPSAASQSGAQYTPPPGTTHPLAPCPQAYRQQLGAFLKEVRACSGLPLLKQYLLLYSSISVAKLASLLDMEEGALRQALMALKNKNYVMAYDAGAGADMLGGSFVSVADLDFYIDVDAASGAEHVIVKESAALSRALGDAEVLSRQIVKLQQITAELSALA